MKLAMSFAIAVMTFAGAGTAMAQGERKCQLLTIAQWPVRDDYYRPVVDGVINGQKVGVLIDTGANVSMIHRAAAKKLGLRTRVVRGQFVGVGGASRIEEAYIEEFRIGDARYKNWVAYVSGEHDAQGDITLLLGYDFFHQMDVEFDLPHKAIRLFEAKGCDNSSLAYWSKEAVVLPFDASTSIFVTVRVNGNRLLAEIDSGSTYSSLSAEGALQLGVTPQTPGVVSAGCATGLGQVRVDNWIAPFESFVIGDEIIRSPHIRFGNVWQQTTYAWVTGSNIARRVVDLPDMILGSDFLRAHRVYIAHSQRKLYLSYVGGTVFPATPGKPCSEIKD